MRKCIEMEKVKFTLDQAMKAQKGSRGVCVCVCVCVYIYICIYVCMCIVSSYKYIHYFLSIPYIQLQILRQ